MTRNLLLAGIIAVAFALQPLYAAELDTAPTSLKPDTAVDAASDTTVAQPSDQAMQMSSAAEASDAFPNFGPSSGTVVGNRALELRDEVLRLRASVNLNSNQFSVLRSSGAAGAVQYHSTVAAITARLQNGTTRGNPILLRQWDEANASLDEVTSSLNRLNSLSTAIDADASMASYLMESVQAAFQLSGAVDEDHDQLKLLKDELSRQIVQLDYLRNQTANDIERQANYLSTERANLQALSFAISRGELLGNSLANRPIIVTMPPSMVTVPQQGSYAPAPRPAPYAPVTTGSAAPSSNARAAAYTPPAPISTIGTGQSPSPMSPRDYMRESEAIRDSTVDVPSESAPPVGQLLVLIRYDQPNVEYQQQLSQAIGSAVERRPDAEFSVVAVAPAEGDPADLAKQQQAAQSDADGVKRSLVQMGLPPSRITMAATQMQSAQTPEVHVYIR